MGYPPILRPYIGGKPEAGYAQRGYEPPPFYVEEVPGSMSEESKQLSARDPGGFRQLFLNECILQLDQREREFEEYERHSQQLRVMVCLRASSLHGTYSVQY